MGEAGQVYVLLGTTNLVPAFWTPLVTNTAGTNGAIQFGDSRRFYRLSTP